MVRDPNQESIRKSTTVVPYDLPGGEGPNIIDSLKESNVVESLEEFFCTVSGGRLEIDSSGRQYRDGVSAVENLRKPLAQMMSKMCSLALSVSEAVCVSSFSFFGLVVPHYLFTVSHMFFPEPLLTQLRAYSKRRTYSGATAGASSGSAAGGLYQRF